MENKTMLSYKYIDSFSWLQGSLNSEKMNLKNADWHLFQIGRGLSIRLCNIQQVMNRTMYGWANPLSNGITNETGYTYQEAELYCNLLSALIGYIEIEEKRLLVDVEKISTEIKELEYEIRLVHDVKIKHKLEVDLMEQQKLLIQAQKIVLDFVMNLAEFRLTVENKEVSVHCKIQPVINLLKEKTLLENFKFTEMNT